MTPNILAPQTVQPAIVQYWLINRKLKMHYFLVGGESQYPGCSLKTRCRERQGRVHHTPAPHIHLRSCGLDPTTNSDDNLRSTSGTMATDALEKVLLQWPFISEHRQMEVMLLSQPEAKVSPAFKTTFSLSRTTPSA